jgi:uncharacterized damage-inducible protein DinB
MKELLYQYALFNAWAHKRLMDLILSLPVEQQHQEIPSSFPSLYKTVFHVWSSEKIWWGRVQGEKIFVKEDPFHGSMLDCAGALMELDRNWLHWVEQQNESSLKQEMSYKNLKGEDCNDSFYQILLHLLNHATYHRGQLVTLLHHVGAEKIPATDFIVWARMRG